MEFAGRNGVGGYGVSETAKPALSTIPPCRVASPPLRLLPCVANQIKSLQDNALIPCQTKVCMKTWEDSSVAPGLVREANTTVRCVQVPQRSPSTCQRPERFLVALAIRFNEGSGQLVSKTEPRVSGHRLHPRKQKYGNGKVL